MRLVAFEGHFHGGGFFDGLHANERDQRVLGFGVFEIEDPFDHPLFAGFDLGFLLSVSQDAIEAHRAWCASFR